MLQTVKSRNPIIETQTIINNIEEAYSKKDAPMLIMALSAFNRITGQSIQNMVMLPQYQKIVEKYILKIMVEMSVDREDVINSLKEKFGERNLIKDLTNNTNLVDLQKIIYKYLMCSKYKSIDTY